MTDEEQAQKEVLKAQNLKLKLDISIDKVEFLRKKFLTKTSPEDIALNSIGQEYFKTILHVHNELTLRPSYITRHFIKAESDNPDIITINQDAKKRLMHYMGDSKESTDTEYKSLMQNETFPTNPGTRRRKKKGTPNGPSVAAATALLKLLQPNAHPRTDSKKSTQRGV